MDRRESPAGERAGWDHPASSRSSDPAFPGGSSSPGKRVRPLLTTPVHRPSPAIPWNTEGASPAGAAAPPGARRRPCVFPHRGPERVQARGGEEAKRTMRVTGTVKRFNDEKGFGFKRLED